MRCAVRCGAVVEEHGDRRSGVRVPRQSESPLSAPRSGFDGAPGAAVPIVIRRGADGVDFEAVPSDDDGDQVLPVASCLTT
jgi:hypothetical protein